MTDLTQNELVREIGRDVVTQLAPQELPIFSAASEAYFSNPGNATKRIQSEDRVLGFGLEPTAALLTPVVLAILSEMFQFLVQIAKKAVEEGLETELSEVIKRMFTRFACSKSPVLTKEQITLIHGKVLLAARDLRLSDDQAASIANAVVAQFFISAQ